MSMVASRFKSWFTEKRFPSSHLRLSDLLMNSLYLSLAVILTLIIYKNISLLNEYFIIFINIGSAALCIGAFFVLKYAYRIVKNLKYGFHGLANGYKFLLILAVLLLALGFYHRQERYIPLIKENVDAINFTYFNPIYIETSSVAAPPSAKKDAITGDLTVKTSDDSSSKSFIENIFPSPEPISEKTKEIEMKIFEFTNKERQSHNKKQLRWDDRLAVVARDHSLDMANNDFFSHTNLRGEDPTARALRHNYNVHKELGNGWFSDGIAENIGEMPTGDVVGMGYVSNDAESIAEAHISSWMNSPGHRANILNDEYDTLGVGVAYDGQYYIATQDFK